MDPNKKWKENKTRLVKHAANKNMKGVIVLEMMYWYTVDAVELTSEFENLTIWGQNAPLISPSFLYFTFFPSFLPFYKMHSIALLLHTISCFFPSSFPYALVSFHLSLMSPFISSLHCPLFIHLLYTPFLAAFIIYFFSDPFTLPLPFLSFSCPPAFLWGITVKRLKLFYIHRCLKQRVTSSNPCYIFSSSSVCHILTPLFSHSCSLSLVHLLHLHLFSPLVHPPSLLSFLHLCLLPCLSSSTFLLLLSPIFPSLGEGRLGVLAAQRGLQQQLHVKLASPHSLQCNSSLLRRAKVICL